MPEYLERAREYQPWEPQPTGETGWPDWTPGFKWPWETPAGQGFQAPWTTRNPLAPMQTMEPAGPNYGPYDDPGQIPPELLEQYDWEEYDQSYIDASGKTAKVTMYRLIPKAEMTPYQQWQVEQAGQGQAGMTEEERRYLELAEEKSRRDYEQSLWERAQAGDPQAMSEWQQWQTEFLPWQAQQEYGLQQQQLDMQRQEQLANLAAHPINWLQYEALKGQPPVVQPWMLPMMSQQYPELAGLQAGQPIPGWEPTGGQAPGYQPFQPGGTPGGQAPTPGLGEMLQGGQMAIPSLDELMAKYQGMGLSPQEAEQESLHELAYLKWRSIPSGQGTQEKRISYLEMGQTGSQRPETQQRYQQAIEAAQSGQPLLGGLSSREKLALVGQLIEQGMDRTLAERQVFGGDMFGKYTPVEDITRTPTPTTRTPTTPRREPTKEREPIPESRWVGERPEIPRQEPKKIPAYLPGRSWHMVDDPLKSSGIRERFNREPLRSQSADGGGPTLYQRPTPNQPPTLPNQPIQPPPPGPDLWQKPPWVLDGGKLPLTRPEEPMIPNLPPPGRPPYPGRPNLPITRPPELPTPYLPPEGRPPYPGLPLQSFRGQPRGPDLWPRPPWVMDDEGPTPYLPPEGRPPYPGLPTQPESWGGGMPPLLNPSAQLWARMGPTAQQMAMGYEQARTGIRPEEYQFRLQSMAPPAGRWPGLSYAR